MDRDVELLKRIYDRFNARDIDGVLTGLTDDVTWANGMDGGHVHGREAVRAYWTRQWAMVSPHVEPVDFHRTADGAIVAEVRQTSPLARREFKRHLQALLPAPVDHGAFEVLGGGEVVEGLRAFKEKRPPNFRPVR